MPAEAFEMEMASFFRVLPKMDFFRAQARNFDPAVILASADLCVINGREEKEKDKSN